VEGEVSAAVFDKYRLATYAEAGYKPFVIASIIAMTRMKDPAAHMRRLVERAGMRVL
jgi:hypothetical protein